MFLYHTHTQVVGPFDHFSHFASPVLFLNLASRCYCNIIILSTQAQSCMDPGFCRGEYGSSTGQLPLPPFSRLPHGKVARDYFNSPNQVWINIPTLTVLTPCPFPSVLSGTSLSPPLPFIAPSPCLQMTQELLVLQSHSCPSPVGLSQGQQQWWAGRQVSPSWICSIDGGGHPGNWAKRENPSAVATMSSWAQTPCHPAEVRQEKL